MLCAFEQRWPANNSNRGWKRMPCTKMSFRSAITNYRVYAMQHTSTVTLAAASTAYCPAGVEAAFLMQWLEASSTVGLAVMAVICRHMRTPASMMQYCNYWSIVSLTKACDKASLHMLDLGAVVANLQASIRGWRYLQLALSLAIQS